MYEKDIEQATEKFKALLTEQLERNDRIKSEGDFTDFETKEKIVIGVCGGDGIGPIITKESARVLEYLLQDEVDAGKVEFKVIDGLTIENRIAHMQAIPDDVMEELKQCDVILKGPTTTPQAGDGRPNIESANVAMRKALDLFANVRPVRIPEQGIDWTFFRENTEGAYAVGSKGVNVNDDLAVDFVVTTTEGSERIARLAYEYAKNNKKDRVSIIQKANVIKTTDGKFLNLCKNIGKKYPDITTDEWYIDITTAKLIDEKRRRDFKVFILPNLYGDIITDEAAQIQGGVGTAGSANLGGRYAMFEAIHGSAPRKIENGEGDYANPASILKALELLLRHIALPEKADRLAEALSVCTETERRVVVTGHRDGATCAAFGDYLLEKL